MTLKILLYSSLFLVPFVSCESDATARSRLERRITVLFDYYEDKRIDFGGWIELLTLCLAPLIAHIIAGVPRPVILHDKKPSWHDRIGHFNPTSIVWRYLTILDRRVRTKSWTPITMAASNANFWTEKHWDGSEDMIWKSRRFCTRPPTKSRVAFLSGTATKTLIVGLQGIQALYQLIVGVAQPDTKKYADILAVHTVFAPLSIIGLFRLPAALWLTEDFAYANLDEISEPSHGLQLDATGGASAPLINAKHESTATVELLNVQAMEIPDEFYPANSWRGLVVLFSFLVPIFGLWAITLFYITPLNGRIYTTTNFMVNLFYLIFLTGCLVIIYGYLWKKRKENVRSTIIPCINSTWYKLYTAALITAAVGLIIVSALETRKAPCGRYTTIKTSHDRVLCPELYKNGYPS